MCGVAIYNWVFAPGVLARGSGYRDLAVLHRGSGEWAGALIQPVPCLMWFRAALMPAQIAKTSKIAAMEKHTTQNRALSKRLCLAESMEAAAS